MTQEEIQKTFDSFIAWLKNKTNEDVKVEKITVERVTFSHGIRILSNSNSIMNIGYGDTFEEAMEDVLNDVIIDYEYEEINNCDSIEELAVRLAVMGF